MIHQLLYVRPVTRDKVFGIDWASISFWLNHEKHEAGRMMKTATDMKPQSCIFLTRGMVFCSISEVR